MTYAAVAAKTSTRRALLNVLRARQNSSVKTHTSTILALLLRTLYRMTMDARGVADPTSAPTTRFTKS